MLLRMSRPLRRALLAALLAPAMMVAAGCGSSSSGAKAGSGESAHAQPSSCPTPGPVQTQFPAGASSDLPRPDFATSPTEVPVTVKGVTLLRFTTAMSLRQAVAFLIKQYPAAGYRVLNGDSEEEEADAPFVKGNLHGKTRISGTGPCSTTWLVAVTKANASLEKLPGLESHDHDSDNGGSDGDSGDSD
jgi:hypothetical protein